MKLRSFLYLNTKIVNDYLAAIDGYTHDVETRTERNLSRKEGGVNASVAGIGGKGAMGCEQDEEVKKEVQISAAAKFEKVFDYISNTSGIKYYELLSDSDFSDMSRDDFLDVLVSPRFSKVKVMSDTAKQLGEFMENFQTLMDEPMVDKEGREAIDGLSKLGEFRENKEISCVFNFENKKFPIVAYLDEQYFSVKRDQFLGQVYLMCKVQRKLKKGEKVELDEVFDSIKKMPLNREQRRKLSKKDLENPEALRDVVRGPAIIVTPIAVYH